MVSSVVDAIDDEVNVEDESDTSGSTYFVNKYRREFCTDVICLFEMRISKDKSDGVIAKIGFPNSFPVEAEGYVRGIWVFRMIMSSLMF
ncbi:hypothetical protein Golob_012560 [Gossypium lobatum]|uniref:Uncharacterized protein n=1 Tax=Gossypium lobatum TaxID=34289 RepID=A0A7J8LM32_9ROSI|nr:hypothetical protein [Gossypium lobatum]